VLPLLQRKSILQIHPRSLSLKQQKKNKFQPFILMLNTGENQLHYLEENGLQTCTRLGSQIKLKNSLAAQEVEKIRETEQITGKN